MSDKAMNTPDQDREAFEQWASDRSWPLIRINEGVQGAARYEDMFVSCAWLAWQARAALASVWPTAGGDYPQVRDYKEFVMSKMKHGRRRTVTPEMVISYQLAELEFIEKMKIARIIFDPALAVEYGLQAALGEKL